MSSYIVFFSLVTHLVGEVKEKINRSQEFSQTLSLFLSSLLYTMDLKKLNRESKIRFWQKNQGETNLMHDLIKLSTVNVSGIYLPPSPSDESNSPTKDYFETLPLHFHVPTTDRLSTQRQLYTPSQQFISL